MYRKIGNNFSTFIFKNQRFLLYKCIEKSKRFFRCLYIRKSVLMRSLRWPLSFAYCVCSGRLTPSFGDKSIGNLRTSTDFQNNPSEKKTLTKPL